MSFVLIQQHSPLKSQHGFCGPFPSGSYLIVTIDDYSRYLVVEILSKLKAKAVIPKLDNVFALFAYPTWLKLTTDLRSIMFKEFANY